MTRQPRTSFSKETLQDGCDLRTGGMAFWCELCVAHAVDEPFCIGPAHGFFGPGTDAFGVAVGAEGGAGADVLAFILGVVHEDGGHLFAGDGVIWPEGAVAVAVDDAFFISPVDGVFVVSAACYVTEAGAVTSLIFPRAV